MDRVSSDYDFCIIDCPPNVRLLTFNAMRASSDVLIPVETGYFSLHGLAKQLELLEQLRKQCRQDMSGFAFWRRCMTFGPSLAAGGSGGDAGAVRGTVEGLGD